MNFERAGFLIRTLLSTQGHYCRSGMNFERAGFLIRALLSTEGHYSPRRDITSTEENLFRKFL